jgi:hypothetical protein
VLLDFERVLLHGFEGTSGGEQRRRRCRMT